MKMHMTIKTMAAAFCLATTSLVTTTVVTGGLQAAPVAQAETAWDVKTPRGQTRTIDFETDEGTWMSVDISPDGKWIVFDLMGELYRIPAKGGKAELLTRDSGIAINFHPKYSPDGKTIVFVSDRGGQDNLWFMDADGGNIRPFVLDLETRFTEPSWAPDGKSIVVTRRLQRPGFGFIVTTDTIWQLPVDGTPGRELVGLDGKLDVAEDRWGGWRTSMLWNGADRHQWPTVSPDGRYVYFHTSPYGGNPRILQRYDLTTGDVQDVTEKKDRYSGGDCCLRRPFPLYLTELAPQVSPDGKWLAFARRIPEGKFKHGEHEVTGRTALWLRNLETGEDRVIMDPITRDAGTNLSNYQERVLPGYSWARDGKSIVISEGGHLKRLWIASGKVEHIPFTARVHRVISEMTRNNVRIEDENFAPRFMRWPVTGPDGQRMVFEAAGTLWLKTAADAAPKALVKAADGEVQMTPAWSPDGKRIAFTTAVNGGPGHIWTVGADGRGLRRVTDIAALYMRPSFSADGKWIYGDRWPNAVTHTHDGREWEVIRVAATGGKAEELIRTRVPTTGDAAHGDKRFYMKPGEQGVALLALDLATRTTRDIALVQAMPEELQLSPDGKHLAIQQYQDAYVLPMAGIDAKTPIDVLTHPAVERITRAGGRYLRWRDNGTLELASASDHVTFDLGARKAASAAFGLTLPRDIGRGVIALKGARILTMNKREVIAEGDILIKDGRITCVGVCATPDGAKTINVQGKTIMPGLFDVHAHAFPDMGDEIVSPRRAASAAYMAYGVTTIHDPDGGPVPTFTLSDMVEAGRMVGPRTFSTEYSMTCTGEGSHLRQIRTVEDALDHIDRKKKFGALSLKDYLQCTRTQRQMLAEAARQRGMSLTTELGPIFYMIGQAMNGHTGWEHSLQYVLYKDVTEFLGRAGSTYSPQAVLSDFSNGTALEYWVGRSNLLTDPKVSEWTPWQRAVARRVFIEKPKSEYIFPFVAEGAARIKAAGGHVAIGGHGEVDGLGTHWEIWTLASAMPNDQVLEAATIDSARFIGLDQELGSIEVGKIADLIILDANPLENIENTVLLSHVMKAGKLYDARTLREIWPGDKAYGPKPWRPDAVYQTDSKSDRP